MLSIRFASSMASGFSAMPQGLKLGLVPETCDPVAGAVLYMRPKFGLEEPVRSRVREPSRTVCTKVCCPPNRSRNPKTAGSGMALLVWRILWLCLPTLGRWKELSRGAELTLDAEPVLVAALGR
mmetsp:Transcript_29200/g.61174  ORF Transcript_29200/g.61174 Transcript_29200/m.61174 type:complete len:124 (-) Transcript_29200:516-887(-)